MRPRTGWMLTLGVVVVLAAPALAQQPSQAQISAVRGACRGDYPSVCAGVPTGGKAALQCLQQHAAQVSPGCRDALAPLATAPPAAAGPPPAATAGATPSAPPPQMSRRAEIRLLRADCGADFRSFCADTQPGGGRALACLRAHGPQLSQPCQSALTSASQAR